MKITSLAVVLASVALTLASASNPCQAGSITYDFVEATGAPNPGDIGATITISSPPAQSSSGWDTASVLDVIGLQILDHNLFISGYAGPFRTSSISGQIISPTGPAIGAGDLVDIQHHIEISIEALSNTDFSSPGLDHSVPGTWSLAQTVPEPASAVQAGIAIAIGLALAAFRKR